MDRACRKQLRKRVADRKPGFGFQLKHLSPRLSPTLRNTTLLAATRRYGDRVPSISQLVDKVRDPSVEVEN